MSVWIDAVIMILCLALGLCVLALCDVVKKLREAKDGAEFEACKAWWQGYEDCKKWSMGGDENAFEQ